MVSRDRIALAAFLLAAALLAIAGACRESLPTPCRTPTERSARDEATFSVDCTGRPGRPLRGPARLLFGLRLDPNRADASALEVLPGIGPARAAAIVAERERTPFGSVAALERVSGIGPVTRERVTPWLEIRRRPAEATFEQKR